MNLYIKPLSADDGQDIYDMLREMPKEENGFINECQGKDEAGYRQWLKYAVDIANGIGLEDQMVPQSVFWLYDGGRPVGMGKVRHYLNERLLIGGGHIGYGIRPSARGRGYGGALLSFLLAEARKLGIGNALVNLRADNTASLRVALGNGGVLSEVVNPAKYSVWISTDLAERFREVLRAKAPKALVGFADLRALPESMRDGYPYGVAVGLPWDKDVLRGIENGPTQAYHENYDRLNDQLDDLDLWIEKWLTQRGYRALGKTRTVVGPYDETKFTTKLPHKTVATRAGLGWIGKCALLITPEYGSGQRISSVLTDAPLTCGTPMEQSRCRGCDVCRTICPGGAVSGKQWNAGMPREAFWDAHACERTARARSRLSLGKDHTLCGLCILHCPWTQKYLRRADD